MKELTLMTIFDRFNIKVIVAGAGLCGAAMSFSPIAVAVPFMTGGYGCVQGMSGAAPAAGGPGGAAGAGGAAACCGYGGGMGAAGGPAGAGGAAGAGGPAGGAGGPAGAG